MESQIGQKYVSSTHEMQVLYMYFTRISCIFYTYFTCEMQKYVKYVYFKDFILIFGNPLG